MQITIQPQEAKVILSNIDKLVNSTKDSLLVECLYCLAIELSPTKSNEKIKYTNALKDLRFILESKTIEPIAVTEHAEFSASNGYYYFRFKNDSFGESAKISVAELKANFNFTWNKKLNKSWQFKQSNFPFNIDYFISTMTQKIEIDAKRILK